MASKTRKLRAIRKNHRKPNKANLKADLKRTQKNREILTELAAEDRG
ncbi:MAG: hypothetical protein ACOWYE_07110 [Desulfatiglandales bacterium]